MPEYLAPGVYVEEVPSGLKPIEGVSTSTAGFVGGAERGPLAPDVRLVTSFPEFERIYGGLIDPAISYLPFAVRGFFENGGRRAFVARVFAGANQNVASAAVGNLQLQAVGPGDWGTRLRVWYEPRPASGAGGQATFKLTIAYFDATVNLANLPAQRAQALELASRVEEFDKLTVISTSLDYVVTVLKTGSTLVAGSFPANQPPQMPPAAQGPLPFAGGAAPTAVGQPELQQGLAALADIDLVNILCVPDQGRVIGIAADMRTHCENLKDRFAILQGAPTWTTVPQFAQNLPVSSYVAVYHPWIRVYNPQTRDTLLVPPSGHVAGVYARTDIERGVHKAPANEILRGIYLRDVGNERALAQIVNRAQHDIFNPANINIIRDFRGDRRGIRVYGARTFSDDPEWRYVNVRRLFLFIEESIDEGTQWVVFEPNYEATWAGVRRNVSNFLLSVWRSGGLAGLTQEEAFFVKCDRETMTQADIDAGRLICLVGVAPVKPAEFVIFRISQKTVEAS